MNDLVFDGGDDLIDENNEQEQKTPEATFLTFAVYLIDLAPGGPEEGGWYYQTGELVESLPPVVVPKSILPEKGEDGRYLKPDGTPYDYGDWDNILPSPYKELVEGLKQYVAHENEGRRPISSVLSAGMYDLQCWEGWPDRYYPTRRPHYE